MEEPMIDPAIETRCKACGEKLQQAARRGPHPREYCNDTCRQRAKRARDERKYREQQQVAMRERWGEYPPEVQQALENVMQTQSVGLAEQVAGAIKAAYEGNTSLSRNTVAYQEKLQACANRVEKLERQVEVQKQRLGQYYQSHDTQTARIAELEQEVRKLQTLLDTDTLYRQDTKERSFQSWLKSQVAYQEGSFSARLLADKAIPQRASKALYIQTLKQLGYSPEDMEIFRDLWITMLRKS
jgi:chromosome segregation ATPase